jgi:hypothetical protein
MVNPFKDVNWHPDRVARRSFAVSLMIGFPVLAALFAVIAWWQTGKWGSGYLWLGGVGSGVGAILWVVPQLARPFYLLWHFLACCIGIVVSNALLAAFYYVVITPTGLVMRILGRDPMRRRWDASVTSYWTDAQTPVEPERYFRQF